MNDQILPRGEQTRTAIVQAARDLFIQQGFHRTSMRQIAQRADIALGGLYNHFDSKGEIFKAVFLEYHPYREVLPVLQAARIATIEEFANDAIRRMIMALQDHPEFLKLMFIEVVEFNNLHISALFNTLMPQLLGIFQTAIEPSRDRLRPIPTLIMLRFYFGLFFAYFVTEILFAKQAPPEFREGAVDYFVDMFLHGVLRPEGAGSGSSEPADEAREA
jgi:AcrR family transcriptional regulator